MFADFPEFFKNRNNVKASLMAFGFECGDGWFDLIYNLCKDIKSLNPSNFVVLQVKEKFGGLRFYVGGGKENIWKLIDRAGQESCNICEKCGKPGDLKLLNGWYLTRCGKHFKREGK